MAIKVPIVLLPDPHLRKLLSHAVMAPTLLTPGHVRNAIGKSPQLMERACRSRPDFSAALLSYCLLDIDDNNPYDLVSPLPVTCTQ